MPRQKRALYKVGGLYLIDRGGYYQIYGFHGGKRYRKSIGISDFAQACIALDDFVEELDCGWDGSMGTSAIEWRAVAKAIWLRHKNSANTRGMPFDLKVLDVFLEMERNNFQCAVSGIAFSTRGALQGTPDPWAPSIDRIESRHGYTKENVRVVCFAANIAMNRYGFDVLLRLSRAVVRREGRGERLTHPEHSPSVEGAEVIEFAKVSR